MVTKRWTWAFFAMSVASCRCDGGQAQKPPEPRAVEEDARVQAVVAKENAEQAVQIKDLEDQLAAKKVQLKEAEDSAQQAHTGGEKGLRFAKADVLRKQIADLQGRIDALRAGDAATKDQ